MKTNVKKKQCMENGCRPANANGGLSVSIGPTDFPK